MPPKPKLVFSEYQNAIFDDIKNGKDGTNTIVIARAGAAKTSSLVEGVKYIPKKKKTLFLAFNKSIQMELDERINKSYIVVKTVHSLGMATIRNNFGKVAFDPEKTQNIAQNILYAKGYKKFEKAKFNIVVSLCKAVNLCKSMLIDTPSKIDILLDEFDIDTFDMEREEFIKTVCQVLRKCKEEKGVIDYGDMIFFPYCFGMIFEKYDRVFLDEAQDMSAAQLHIAISSCKKDGRILACSDDKQVLYQFAGVNIDAVDILTKRLNAKVLTLPISYRCAKSIVKCAQDIVPDIQHASNAQEGLVQNIPEDMFLPLVKPGDFILSRVNAPLIYYCLELIRNKVPANIMGRDIGKGLAYLVRKSEAKTIDEFMIWLEQWKKDEVKRLEDKGRDPILILDKFDCLKNLCKGKKSTEQVLDDINEIFSDADDKDIVRLGSIHKSKGKEANRVFLLDFTLRKDGSQGELNVEYVAKTRAKLELYIVKA